jgi:pimeloyl-ACP methyl ester carboxylesterase
MPTYRVDERLSPAEEWKMLTMTDGTSIRVCHRKCKSQTNCGLTFLFLGGWGVPSTDWNALFDMAAVKFDLVILETREKSTSILSKNTKCDLDRVSEDIRETLDHFHIDQSELIIYGFSWGGLVAANQISEHNLKPLLLVLVCPIAQLPTPAFTRYLVPLLPVRVLEHLKPLVKYWIKYFRSNIYDGENRAIQIVEEADVGKWKMIGSTVWTRTYWHLYSKISVETIILYASDEAFHDTKECKRIAQLLRTSQCVELVAGTGKFFNLILATINEQLPRTNKK